MVADFINPYTFVPFPAAIGRVSEPGITEPRKGMSPAG